MRLFEIKGAARSKVETNWPCTVLDLTILDFTGREGNPAGGSFGPAHRISHTSTTTYHTIRCTRIALELCCCSFLVLPIPLVAHSLISSKDK